MTRTALTALLAGCLSFGAFGCSSTASVARAPAASPAVAFAASASDVSSSCTPDGTPRVLATHVVPTRGVQAVAEGATLGLRFATTGEPRVAVALDPETLHILGGVAPPAETAASARGPVAVELPDHRRLVAWTEGTVETGLRVHATTLSADGSSEAPFELGYQGSAVGQPAVAVTKAGNGVIAFIESNGAGFHLVVTHLTCTAP